MGPDKLRADQGVLDLVRAFDAAGKPIAFICHAGWVPVSAGIVEGRRVTSVPQIADDLRNAGAEWEDAEVVVDGNLVSSRRPDDLPAFMRELIGVAEGAEQRGGASSPRRGAVRAVASSRTAVPSPISSRPIVARLSESDPVDGSEPLDPAASGELTAADSDPEPVVEVVELSELPELPDPPPPEFEPPPEPPEADELRARTRTVPFMSGWIEQM
jgi:hypothetical protein